MSLKIGDQIRIQPAIGPSFDNSATVAAATLWGMPVAMSFANNYAAQVSVRDMSTLAMRVPLIAKLCVGTTTFASPTAYATVAGSSWTVCASGSTQTGLSYARVVMGGSGTEVAATLIIDGTTFTMGFGGADSSIRVETTLCSLTMAKLTTCIKGMCTHLDATYVMYGNTTGPIHVNIWPKDADRTINITSSGLTPAAGDVAVGLQVVSRSAMFEFKADELRTIMSTVSTLAYDHMAIKLTAVGASVANVSGNFIFGDERYNPHINIARSQLGTVSTAYSS